MRYYRNRGFSFINIVLDSNPENQSSNYLKSIDFENRFNSNFESFREFRFPNSSLPITTVTAADIENKQLEITRFLERKGIEKDFTAIQVCLAEILNNCFDHANSETGVKVHAQYFRSTHTIWLAVCDTGVGLPTCINNYLSSQGLSTISSEEAIKWAFTNTNTTQSTPSNKGLGLNNVLDQTKANRGALRMITHDKWVLHNDRIDLIMRDTKHFFGTAIEIEESEGERINTKFQNVCLILVCLISSYRYVKINSLHLKLIFRNIFSSSTYTIRRAVSNI